MKNNLREFGKHFFYRMLGSYRYEFFRFFLAHYKVPDLDSPCTFNEKLAWRKICDTNPKFATIADKYLARQFVSAKIGNANLSKIYYCGDYVEEINFNELPESFVIKATHGSGPGFISFIKNKHQFGKVKLKTTVIELLKNKYGTITNEWWYTKIRPRVIIEEMLNDETFGIPVDYKFYVFHGEAKFIQVDYFRFKDHSRTFYDKEWHPQEFTLKYPLGILTAKPKLHAEMISIAECLGKDFDFIRVDLYCVNDERIVFG
ncbi:MAG: hypothetical protein IBX69_11135, partial [Anaerolineales bacterium]|nr:hypothetical protein [Anaerolineales bacterium]